MIRGKNLMKKPLLKIIVFCFILLMLPINCFQVIGTINRQSDYDLIPIDDLLEDAVKSIPIDGCVLLVTSSQA